MGPSQSIFDEEYFKHRIGREMVLVIEEKILQSNVEKTVEKGKKGTIGAAFPEYVRLKCILSVHDIPYNKIVRTKEILF